MITFNALDYTKATLNSLFANTDNPYYLTIIDNGSKNDTLEFLNELSLPKQCMKYTLIKNGYNAGVGSAYNQGLQSSYQLDAEYTAFCNNDLFFSSNWLQVLEGKLDDNENIAMLSPLRPSARVTHPSGANTRDYLHGIAETSDWKLEIENYTNKSIEEFNDFCLSIIETNKPGGIELISFPDSLSTCVCLVNNKHFRILNRFADPYFTGYGGEDIDTSWTILSMGLLCAVDHDVYVHHFRGKSLKDNGLNRKELLYHSNKKLYAKWLSYINDFVIKEHQNNIDVIKTIKDGKNSEYWLLHELDNTIGFTNYIKKAV